MEAKLTTRLNWKDRDYLWQETPSTVDPMVTSFELVDEVPTLTVTAIVGVAAVILIAIAIVFVLGVFIDCRQQRIIDSQLSMLKRIKPNRRARGLGDERASIANNMEEQASSPAPVQSLANIP